MGGPAGDEWHPPNGLNCHKNDQDNNNMSDEDKEICSGVPYPSIEADGFTDRLYAMASPTEDDDKWNEMKLAVGDVGDGLLDSWVLLGKESFTCQDITSAPSVSVMPSSALSLRPSISQSPSQAPTTMPSVSSAPSTMPSIRPTLST